MNYNSISFKVILSFFIIISVLLSSTIYLSLSLNNINNDSKLINKGYIVFLNYLSKIEANINNDRYIIVNFINDSQNKLAYKKT